jgi:hypothetical protein
MAKVTWVQWRRGVGIVSLLLLLGLTALIDVVALRQPVGNDPKNALISLSAVPPIVVWVGCLPLAFVRRLVRPTARYTWTLACVLVWVHIAVAFHLGHGWSHQAAWDGIFVNYAVALVWLIDAVWALVAFDSYRARPGWLHWSIHGFLAFVMFNAAVVFASPEVRTCFAVLCAALAIEWIVWRRRRARRASESGRDYRH